MIGLLLFLGLFIFCLLQLVIDDKQEEKEEKEEKERKLELIKDRVREGYKDLKSSSKYWGVEYSESLLAIAESMDKLSSNEIKDDLKPYDVVINKDLNKVQLQRMKGIVILDKNLKPKFFTDEGIDVIGEELYDTKDIDIKLDTALDANGVRKLAEECKNIEFAADTEKFRKDKISEFLNN
jgi:hypothetical protein